MLLNVCLFLENNPKHFKNYRFLIFEKVYVNIISKLKANFSLQLFYAMRQVLSKEITLGAFNNCAILGEVIGKDYIKVTQMYSGVKSYGFIQLNGNQISKSKYV